MIGASLLRYAPDQKYMIWDLETTSLNLIYGLPWQCSFIICTLSQILEEHDYFIKWDDFKISRDAAAITNFNHQEYQNKGRDPREILDIMEGYMHREDVIVLGHHILGYDVMIHRAWRRKLGLGPDYSYLPRLIDTNAISKALKKGYPPDRDNILAFQYKMLNFRERGLKTSLGVMARELGVNFNDQDLHRGDKDILLNWQVWKKLVWSVEI